MGNVSSTIDTLRQHADYISEFTSKNIDEIEKLVSDSTICCKNLVDAFGKKNASDVTEYGNQISEYLNELNIFMNEVFENAKSLTEN